MGVSVTGRHLSSGAAWAPGTSEFFFFFSRIKCYLGLEMFSAPTRRETYASNDSRAPDCLRQARSLSEKQGGSE